MSNKITYSNKVGIVPKTSHINQVWDDDMNEIKDKHNLNDDRITNLEENQITGVRAYKNLADLPSPGVANISYKVTNDSVNNSNNGYYTWNGSSYDKDAELVETTIQESNTSVGVSGSAVFEHVQTNNNNKTEKPIKTIVDASTFKPGELGIEQGRNFFVDLYLQGFDGGKYYGASIINGVNKSFTIYEVDANGNFVDAGNPLAIVSDVDYTKDNYYKMHFNNGTYIVDAIVDWNLITTTINAIPSIRFDSRVYTPHYGLLSEWESTIKTTNVMSELVDVAKYSGFTAWNAPSTFNIDNVNNGFNFSGHNTGSSGGISIVFTPSGHALVYIQFNADKKTVAENVNLYIYGDNIGYLSLGLVENGLNTFSFDPAYYSVYFNQSDFRIVCAVSNTTNTDEISITNFVAFQNTLYQKGVYGDNLEIILENITAEAQKESFNSAVDYKFTPNGSKYIMQLKADLNLQAIPVFAENVLFVGNSLLLGNEGFGMASTDETKDYYYKLSNLFYNNVSGYVGIKISGTSYEGATTEQEQTDFKTNILLPALNTNVQLVLFQLGDNINTPEKQTLFQNDVENLLNYTKTNAPNARVVWCGTWYTPDAKNIAIQGCKNTGIQFIDISDLTTDINRASIGDVITYTSQTVRTMPYDSYVDNTGSLTVTFTVNTVQHVSTISYVSFTDNTIDNELNVTGVQAFIFDSGVASHPGDNGMLAITNRLAYELGAINNEGDIT